MSAKSIVGYVFLFIFLFLLIGVHSGFALLFFIAIIVVIGYKIKQRKKSKSDISSHHSQNYEKETFAHSLSNNDNPSTKNNDILIEHDSETEVYPSEESKTNLSFETSMTPPPPDNDISRISDNLPVETNFINTNPVKTSEKSFDRYYWSFRNNQSFEIKKLKFERALEYCKENNLGSKTKLRRLQMKMNRWNIENERDVEAMIPDYESLIDLIEEFENQ